MLRRHAQIATVLLLGLGLTAPVKAQAPAWPPPLQVGWKTALLPAPGLRTALCDFARHAASLAGTPVPEDPIFRSPAPQNKARLGEVLKFLPSGKDLAGLQRQLGELLVGPDGPALARLALAAEEPRTLAAALRAATVLAAAHPRLAGLVGSLPEHPAPEVAKAAIGLMFATGCDMPVLYALDGLHHADESVQLEALRQVEAVGRQHRDVGAVERVLRWLADGKGTPRARVVAVRMLARLGWLPATPTLDALADGPDARVAGEALAALGALAPDGARGKLAKALGDRDVHRRAGAVRGAAEAWAMQADAGHKLLAPLGKDASVWVDPVDSRKWPLAELVRRARAHWSMDPQVD